MSGERKLIREFVYPIDREGVHVLKVQAWVHKDRVICTCGMDVSTNWFSEAESIATAHEDSVLLARGLRA